MTNDKTNKSKGGISTELKLPYAKPEEVGISSERLERIRVAMQRYVDKELVPGVAWLVARDGKVVRTEAIGKRDVENNLPMTVDTIFRIASMTKPIVSVALMMLFEEGHFLLSDPASKWIPEFADAQVALPISKQEIPRSKLPARAPGPPGHYPAPVDSHRWLWLSGAGSLQYRP